MITLASLLMRFTAPRLLRNFRQACADPMAEQRRLLAEILSTNGGTRYGKDHGFAEIGSFEEYRDRIPLNTFEDLKPYVEAMLNGESGQLTSEDPILFAMTSGTTGDRKHIPVTPASRRLKKDLLRLWMCGIYVDHPGVFAGKFLAVVSPEEEERSPGGTPCGAESGHGYKNVSPLIKSLYASPYEVFTIADYDARYYTLLRLAAAQDIRLIYACNPSTILLLAEGLAKHAADIVRDVRDGTLSAAFAVEPEIRGIVEAGLKPDAARSRELEAAAAGEAGLTPATAWPNLALVTCWKGGNMASYLDSFPKFFKKDQPVREIGYLASELRGSVPLSDADDTGPLAIQTNVYEFHPVDAKGNPGPRTLLTLDQLEVGKRYFLHVTTASGLYRYDMNDIVEVTGLYEKTPMIRFVQKGKGVISFTGEKLHEEQVVNAVKKALGDGGGDHEFIQAVGRIEGNVAQYAFLIEFANPPDEPAGVALIKRIDECLSQENSEYASKRASKRIAMPTLRVVKQGALDAYRKNSPAKEGNQDGQFKTLKLTDDTALADALEIENEYRAE